MFKKVIILTFNLIAFSVFCQENTLDSLITTLNENTKKDTIRVNSLIEVGSYYMDRDMEKVLPYLQEALAISKTINAKHQRIKAQNELAYYYRAKGVWDEAMKQAIIAKKEADSLGTKKQKLIANSGLHIVYANSGNDKESLAIILENIDLTKNDPPSSARARTYFDAGNMYLKLGHLYKVEENYNIAIEMCRQINFKPGEMVMLMSLSDLFKEQKHYTKALQTIDKPLKYYVETSQTVRIGSANMQIANIKSLQGKHKESILFYLKALKSYDTSGASLHFKNQIHQNLFVAFSILQDYENAQKYNKAYNKLKDSITSLERKKFTQELKVKYETDKINAEKESAEAKAKLAETTSKQNKNYFISATIITLLTLVTAFFLVGRLKTRKKMELVTIELKEAQKRLALEKQYRDSELKALKSQMNPHFIFNALNSIQQYIITKQKLEASDYLGKFATLIRTYLAHSNTGTISIREEIDSLQTYLDLEILRFEDALHYSISVSEDINKDATHIPTMLIQPYVENSLRHGLLHKKNDKELTIVFKVIDPDTLQCTIEDNGVGMDRTRELQKIRNKTHKPFATKANKERLELLNYGKDKKIGVNVIDLFDKNHNANGTRVILTIPKTKRP